MFCKPCSENKQSQYSDGICEVCRYQDDDTTVKKVRYCETCKVSICEKCSKRYDRRFFAMLKKKFDL